MPEPQSGGGRVPVTNNPPPGTIGWGPFLLVLLGAPVTENNLSKLYTWETAEGAPGSDYYNPFNTTLQGYGGKSGTAGITSFPSLSNGLEATAAVIREAPYSAILQNLRDDGSWQSFSKAVWASPWASSHYGYGSNWPSSPVATNPLPSWIDSRSASESASVASGEGVLKKTEGANVSLPGAITSFASAVVSGMEGMFAPFTDMFKILAWLTNPLHWLRIFCGILGLAFGAGGVVAIVGVF